MFIKYDREAYVAEYKKCVGEIFEMIYKNGTFEVATDDAYRDFQVYVRGKRFRVDKRFRESMGREKWKGVYLVIRGRLAGLNKKLF